MDTPCGNNETIIHLNNSATFRSPQSEGNTTLSLLIEVRDECLERGELLKAKAVEKEAFNAFQRGVDILRYREVANNDLD